MFVAYPFIVPSIGSLMLLSFAEPLNFLELALLAKSNKNAVVLARLKSLLLETCVFIKDTDEFLLNS